MKSGNTPALPAWVTRRLGLAAGGLILAATMLTGCTQRADQDTGTTEKTAAPERSRSQPSAQLSEAQRAANLAAFDKMWELVRDRHWDEHLGGIDWEAVREELRPKVKQARTMREARALMREAIHRLGQSHFGIIPGEVYAKMDKPEEEQDIETAPADEPAAEGHPGLTVRVYDGRVLVTQVRKDVEGPTLLVRPGWEMLAINDEALAPLVDTLDEEYAGSTLRQARLVGAIMARLVGDVGTQVDVKFRSGEDTEVTLRLPRVAPEGRPVSLGYMPTMYMYFESRRLAGDVGYIHFNIFMDPATLMVNFNASMETFMDAEGVVLDLRGNPGGIGAFAMGMAGWFVEPTDEPLGVMHTRDTDLKFIVFSRADVYQGPLAILTDGCTGSTAEILAAGLQDLGRARVFGTQTAGAALPSVFERLPNGDGFQYATANYISQSGRRLEGNGVVPDEKVVPSRAALLQGQDPVLEKALAWIDSQ